MSWQKTVAKTVEFSGVGLHSGKPVRLQIMPAAVNFGIKFTRSDIPGARPTLALATQICRTELSTSINGDGWTISTIEHLMAACAGLGITNALVSVDSSEIPILDGSAAPFVAKILFAGVQRQNKLCPRFVVNETIELRSGDKFIRVEPAMKMSMSCEIDFPSVMIGRQRAEYTSGLSSFLKICDARTFCHVREVEAMRSAGLALGGSLDNAVVVTDDGIMNPQGLRSEREFAKHKLVDLIGDMALLGCEIQGRVVTYKAGHALHAEFTRAILEGKFGAAVSYIDPRVEANQYREHESEVALERGWL